MNQATVTVRARNGFPVPAIPAFVANRLEITEGEYLTDDQITDVVKQTAQLAVFPRKPLRKRIRSASAS